MYFSPPVFVKGTGMSLTYHLNFLYSFCAGPRKKALSILFMKEIKLPVHT